MIIMLNQEREKYKLGNPRSFHYLNQSNCYELAGSSDAHQYLTTRRAMDIVGISETEQVLAFWVLPLVAVKVKGMDIVG